MKKKQKKILLLFICLTGIWTINSCKKEKEDIGTDKELYKMSKTVSDFVWYNHSSNLLNKSSGSAHPYPFLRTRYNSIASSKLDSDGKIMTGATFPEGSLIVKELYENASTLGRYAILYKKSGSVNADANGWVWGYIDADGKIAESASKKGSSCINCHLQTDNIDYMLMNKYFP